MDAVITEVNEAGNERVFLPSLEQRAVIEADSSEWLLVQAGPGTGKTQVAAMRLAHLVSTGLQPAQILVLSFSRSAVATLSRRLKTLDLDDQAVIEELRHLAIRTFDSWAFRMLRQSGEIAADLLSRSHDDNIAAVTKKISDPADPMADRLSGLRHVIVDEFQDLPGVRAEMVVALLRRLFDDQGPRVGFTVLGDPVQAIYRFAARVDGQAIPIDPWQGLRERMGPRLRQLALTFNHRSTERLAAVAASLRKILGTTHLDPARKLAAMQRFVSSIPASLTDAKLSPEWLAQLPEGSIAILARKNGESVQLWKSLMGEGLAGPTASIRLRLAGGGAIAPAWIAGVLSRFKHPTISRKVFEFAYSHAVAEMGAGAALEIGLPPLEIAWTRLARASGAPDSVASIDMEQLRNRLAWPDSFPDDQFNEEAAVYITTIHQAKGMEFDNVALLDAPERNSSDPPEDPLEEAHVGFVAVTRAGKHLERLPSSCIFKSPRSRLFSYGRNRLADWGSWHNKAKWAHMQIGLEGDVDPTSFVSLVVHSDEESVASLQKKLLSDSTGLRNHKVVLTQAAANVRAKEVRYDVRLQQQEGDGFLLGRTGVQLTFDLLDLLWTPGFSLPRNIYNLRIGDVVSLATNEEMNEEIADTWRSSRLWLGITLVGVGDFKTWKRRDN